MALTNTQISQFFLATKGVAATGGTLSALKDLSKTAEISVLENSTSAYAAKDNADFVAGLYRDILNRDGSEDEIKAWSDAVAKFGGRAETLKAFTASVSANDKNAFESSNIDYVKGLYATYANDANPSQADLQAWAKFLNEGTTNRVDIVDLFVNTVKAEINTPHASGLRAYVNELIGDLYNNVLGRPATAGELTAWSNLWFDGKVDSLSGLVDLFNETASKASGDDKAAYDNKMSFCESYGAACPNADQADATHCDASGITAETTDAADQGKTNGEADEQSAPTPAGNDVFVTFDAINGDFADARGVADAVIKFNDKDSQELQERIIKEATVSVATDEATKTVSFDASLDVLKNTETLRIASDEKSVVTVNGSGLANLKALKNLQDENGSTTVNIDSGLNLKNLAVIDLKNGADTLNIGEGARLNALTAISLGDDRAADTLTIAAKAQLDNLSLITTGDGNDKVSIAGVVGFNNGANLGINLGAGDDTLNLSADLASVASIDLGAGTDTLELNAEKYSFSGNLTGIDKGVVVAATHDADKDGTIIDLGKLSATTASAQLIDKGLAYISISKATAASTGVAASGGNVLITLKEFDVKNDLTFELDKVTAASDGTGINNISVDITNVSGIRGGDNSIELNLATAANASGSANSGSEVRLVGVYGTADTNITDILNLGSETATFGISTLKDIDVIKAGKTTDKDGKLLSDADKVYVTLEDGVSIFDTKQAQELELDGAINFTVDASSTAKKSLDLSKVTGQDDNDFLEITVAREDDQYIKAVDLAFDENDGIVEVIKFSGDGFSAVSQDKINITGLGTNDKIDLEDIAYLGWAKSASTAGDGYAYYADKVDADAKETNAILKAVGGAVSTFGYIIADTNDGIGIYVATGPDSIELIAFVDGADIAKPSTGSVEFTIA